MRICVIDTFRDHRPSSGGHAIRVFNVASWLSGQGHSVVILRPADERKTLVSGDAPKIVSIAQSGRLMKVMRPVQIHLFPRMRHFPDSVSMNAPNALKTLRTYIKAADIVQVEDPTLLGPLFMARLYRKRIVADTDGISSQVIRETVRETRLGIRRLLAYSIILVCESLWFRLSSTVITSTQDDKQSVSLLYHLDQSKIGVVPNPIDVGIQTPDSGSRTTVRQSLGLSSDTPTAIFVGDLRVPHNAEAVNFIARMFTRSQTLRSCNVRVIIVGRFDKLPEEWKSTDLIFTGPVQDLAAYIGAADVCIAPVFSQPTGVKTKVLTYLALGKTTVATPAALVGLDDSIRKFVIECSSDDFPSVLLDQLTRIPDSTSDLLVSSKVQSLYGTQAVGMAYYREIIKPFGISPGIMQDASERSDEVP